MLYKLNCKEGSIKIGTTLTNECGDTDVIFDYILTQIDSYTMAICYLTRKGNIIGIKTDDNNVTIDINNIIYEKNT